MTQKKSELELIAEKLLETPGGYEKVLDLATALKNGGRHNASLELEKIILDANDAEAKHRWRLKQSARAPANQYYLLNNAERTAAFQRAFESTIQSDQTVLEIGTGSGILAMLAAVAGASAVYTCEHQALMASVAAEIIEDNGFENIIQVLAKSSNDLTLEDDIPEKVDVIVCDVFTGSLLEAGGLELVAHAADKFLKPKGLIIPGKGSIKGCLVGGDDLEDLCRATFAAGFDLSRFNLFSPVKVQLQPDQFQNLDFQTFSNQETCFEFEIGAKSSLNPQRKALSIKATQSGGVSGFLQWTDLELAPGISLDAAPSKSIRWPRFLHVFPDQMTVDSGEVVDLTIIHNARQFSVWPDVKHSVE